MRNKVTATAFTWACVAWLAASHAQTVHQADFDTIRPSFGYAYAYSGFGDDEGNHDTGSQVSAVYDVTTLPVATGTLDASAVATTSVAWQADDCADVR